jgi:type VI secretion system FHA domain protein
MSLTLEVVSPNGQGLGPARRKVFGTEGGRIGRSPDCEWVIANPYISRHHATVRWISGTYYIESTGENGVAINTPQAMIPQRERRALRTGDRIFLDEFEIAVAIGGAVSVAESFAPVDPLADLVTGSKPTLVPDPLEPAHDELDPLKQLGGTLGRAPLVPVAVNWNHTPGVSDQFTPPVVPSAPVTATATATGAIPDDWDRTSLGRRGAPGAIPDDWDRTSLGRPASAPGSAVAPPPPPPPPPPQAVPAPGGQRGRGAPLPLRPVPVQQSPAPTATPAPAPAPTATPASAPTATPASAQQIPAREAPAPQPQPVPAPATTGARDFDVTAMLRATGVDPATVPPETAASLGLILRTVVQGVVEVLQARTEIKDQFRLPLTRIKTAENNPLKFSVNAEDALNSLLGRRSSAYLAPVEAFEDAFDDIRFHQMAMLAGMRAGFENVLRRFDPQHLQEQFDKHSKRGGLLQMGAKSRYWDAYADEFRELTGDADDAFKRLFGEVFAEAYERQLEELKGSRGKPPR